MTIQLSPPPHVGGFTELELPLVAASGTRTGEGPMGSRTAPSLSTVRATAGSNFQTIPRSFPLAVPSRGVLSILAAMS
jgi:hypothetical protein